MLLSELAEKEIVNLHDGAKLGTMGESDIRINDQGGIEAIIVSPRANHVWFLAKNSNRENENIVIPWQAVKKIGNEVIIVDIDIPSL
ncbi:sporulation protein, YlmC/YmxH family [Syntrophobotulus glycolicus DSM 8271]|uniref:Sporulation protein, YlmC/YmxH family n=1 Tax=Syntrophobotulus glycolicus (strain DSM 8271 / FlGlyR) TaxID=645991 RepID=F0SU05_SYNGF|nr:YlmC/YmxH family sporulation protein [Syntrophobotulus glycolicus]ADY56528.1 sporulation protein, YlmC/YmxH family [Syntrophobotulus glycolicus DSM 8271]